MFDREEKILPLNQNNIENATITNSNIIQINSENIDITTLIKELKKLQTFPKILFNELLNSELNKCRDLLLRGRFVSLKKVLDKVFESDVLNLEGNPKVLVCFYRFCQLICCEEIANCKSIEKYITGKYLDEVAWINKLCDNVESDIENKFALHLPETQSVVLNRLFETKQFSTIISLSKKKLAKCDVIIQEEILFYTALSYFNMGQYLTADCIMAGLCKDSNQLHHKFFYAITKIFKCNQQYLDGRDDELIEQALNSLEEMREEDIFKRNSELVANTKLVGFFNLGKKKLKYADEGIYLYTKLPFVIQRIPMIRYLSGLLYELKNDYDDALNIYLSLDWKNDPPAAQRLFACYVNKQEYKKVIEMFEELVVKDSNTQGWYLKALKLMGYNDCFRKKLIESVNQYGDSFSDFYYIAIVVEDKTDYYDIIEKQILLMLDSGKTFKGLETHLLIGYANIFSHFGNISLLSSVIFEIDELTNLIDEVIWEIYNGIYLVLQKHDKKENNFTIPNEVEIAETLIDRFLKEKVDEKNFLWLKIICLKIKKKELSVIEYLEQLFGITNDANVAADILMLQHKHNKYGDKLNDYLQLVQQSQIAGHIMVAAITYQHLGRYNEADFFSYKALYVLNDKDDFDIYQKYLFLHLNNLGHEEVPVTLEKANEKCVITLVSEFDEGEKEWKLCLDGESDFNDDNNHSLGIDHIKRNNRHFAKLSACVCSQMISIDGKKYKVKEIITRTVYAFRYVLSKVEHNPDKFEGVFWSIPVNDSDSFTERISAILNNNEREDRLLNAYYSGSLRTGMPIDLLLQGDYKNYFSIIVKLLYTPNWAFYAGETVIEEKLDDKYVITISTLAILVLMGWVKLIEPIKDRIVCPKSYISFFQKLNAEEIIFQKVSPGIIGKTPEEKLILVENDPRIPELWEEILRLCEGFKQIPVTDAERISYKIIEGLTGEQLITGFKIDVIQLDSLIVASKVHATYLCEDFFFRNIARAHNIKNINFTSFLYHFVEKDTAVEIVKKLSVTNYIFTPFIYRNFEEARDIAKNLMTGDRKRQFYELFFDKHLGYTKSFFMNNLESSNTRLI